MDNAMTEAANIERQKRRQAEFVNDEQQRLLEIEDMRLVVKFGEKRRYSDSEHEAIYQELVEAGLNHDAIEAVYRKLNAADEAEAARRALGGPSTVP
jgi:SOS response regulatory protein OraA/RecX